jgi:serine/threonine protein kinase
MDSRLSLRESSVLHSLGFTLLSRSERRLSATICDYLDIPAELAELTEYTVLKEIGRGGMGVVYLAQHKMTGRKEVLKVLNERLMSHSIARQRFEQEIKCIASMNHETIVRCYTVKQLAGSIVLCMEHVPGTNLHQFVATNGPLPIHIACGIASEVCRGLQHAMDNGLVHRDIKPSNIMLYKYDGKIKAKILDFGLARLSTKDRPKGITDDGTLLGTLEYIAPEQSMNAAAADIRADIYSLGCTLYHMLVGHPPFSGSTGELILAHSQLLPPSINLIRPEVPVELANVVSRMLAKLPARRFTTPSEAAKALSPFLSKNRHLRQIVNDEVAPEAVDTKGPVPAAQVDTSVEVTGGERVGLVEEEKADAAEALPACSIIAGSPPSDSQSTPALLTSSHFDFPSGRVRTLIACVLGSVLIGAIALAVIIIQTKKGTIRISGLPEDTVVVVDTTEQEPVLQETLSTAGETQATSLSADWRVLFDGSVESYYEHWDNHHVTPPGKIEFGTANEMSINAAAGDNDFIGFISKENFGPNFHLSMRYKNFNGSPKVFDFTWHRGSGPRFQRYSVTLGGFHDSKPRSPIRGVGSLQASYVAEPGKDFDIRAKPLFLRYGQSCHMEVLCFDGHIVIKVDGEVVNETEVTNEVFLPKELHFWSKRGAKMSFQEIKIRDLENVEAFELALLPSAEND